MAIKENWLWHGDQCPFWRTIQRSLFNIVPKVKHYIKNAFFVEVFIIFSNLKLASLKY